MTASHGQRALKAGVLAMLAFACAGASAQNVAPTMFEGEPVHTLEFTVRGTTIVLHAAGGGYIPESTDRFRFPFAGPMIQRGVEGRPPTYQWKVRLDWLGDAKPVRVRIEDIDRDVDRLLVDDAAPVLEDRMWTGIAKENCTIAREAECAAWVYAKGLQTWILRATVDFADGTTQTLYQGVTFNPDKMQMLWDTLGVKR